MNSDSELSPSLALFLKEKQRYRAHAKELSLEDRLRQLESLQEQSYEILRIRAANGGKPIPPDWQLWAEAQSDIGLKK
jgi:hypothetical protein